MVITVKTIKSKCMCWFLNYWRSWGYHTQFLYKEIEDNHVDKFIKYWVLSLRADNIPQWRRCQQNGKLTEARSHFNETHMPCIYSILMVLGGDTSQQRAPRVPAPTQKVI